MKACRAAADLSANCFFFRFCNWIFSFHFPLRRDGLLCGGRRGAVQRRGAEPEALPGPYGGHQVVRTVFAIFTAYRSDLTRS